MKLISWIKLLSTLWFFLNLFYLVWNFCVRIMKEMINPSWTNLCFLSAKFFLQVTGWQSDHYGDFIVTTISLPKTKFMKNSEDKSISITTTFHLPFWKRFWIPPIVIMTFPYPFFTARVLTHTSCIFTHSSTLHVITIPLHFRQ